jgi:Ca2+-binding RTX toxin-like protein
MATGPLWLITAGTQGGDFDAFIADMGNPLRFGYASHSANQTVLVHQGQPVNAQIRVVLDAGPFQFVDTVVLRTAGGAMLMSIDLNFLTFGLAQPRTSADGAFDAILNVIQSATVEGTAHGFAFTGKGGADKFTGNLGDDVISGFGGNDNLAGAGGNDSVSGGLGQDVIAGGAGLDRLSGGAGADTFVFSGAAAAASGDRITDFSQAEGDRIDLRAVDAMTGNVGLDHFTLISTGFTSTKGELRINQFAWGAQLRGDIDGDGVGDFTVALLGVTALDATALLLG